MRYHLLFPWTLNGTSFIISVFDVIAKLQNLLDNGRKLKAHTKFKYVHDVFWKSYVRSVYVFVEGDLIIICSTVSIDKFDCM